VLNAVIGVAEGPSSSNRSNCWYCTVHHQTLSCLQVIALVISECRKPFTINCGLSLYVLRHHCKPLGSKDGCPTGVGRWPATPLLQSCQYLYLPSCFITPREHHCSSAGWLTGVRIKLKEICGVGQKQARMNIVFQEDHWLWWWPGPATTRAILSLTVSL